MIQRVSDQTTTESWLTSTVNYLYETISSLFNTIIACFCCDLDCCFQLDDRYTFGDPNTNLFLALSNEEDTRTIKAILDRPGANPNHKIDAQELSVVKEFFEEIGRELNLTEKGIELETIEEELSNLNCQPLHYAIIKGSSKDVIQSLINKGADLNSAMIDPMTPLLLAIIRQNKEAVKVLLDGGASVTVPGDNGATIPLNIIAGNRNVSWYNEEIEQILLDHLRQN